MLVEKVTLDGTTNMEGKLQQEEEHQGEAKESKKY
jgi:hypothetical protein